MMHVNPRDPGELVSRSMVRVEEATKVAFAKMLRDYASQIDLMMDFEVELTNELIPASVPGDVWEKWASGRHEFIFRYTLPIGVQLSITNPLAPITEVWD